MPLEGDWGDRVPRATEATRRSFPPCHAPHVPSAFLTAPRRPLTPQPYRLPRRYRHAHTRTAATTRTIESIAISATPPIRRCCNGHASIGAFTRVSMFIVTRTSRARIPIIQPIIYSFDYIDRIFIAQIETKQAIDRFT